MGKVYFSGLVCDEDSLHLQSSVPHRYLVTLGQIGIARGSSDAKVIEHARDAGCVVITGNTTDFRREMEQASNRCNPARCYEGGGMVSVPNGMSRLNFVKLTRDLRFNGNSIHWSDVFECNLHVAVRRDGTFDVKRLPICEYFIRDHADCQHCIRLGIV